MIAKIKHYRRDKFVAHLDEERTMLLPELEVARRAIVFLHGFVLCSRQATEIESSQPTPLEELSKGFAQAFSGGFKASTLSAASSPRGAGTDEPPRQRGDARAGRAVIRITISQAAFEAIAATLPLGSEGYGIGRRPQPIRRGHFLAKRGPQRGHADTRNCGPLLAGAPHFLEMHASDCLRDFFVRHIFEQ